MTRGRGYLRDLPHRRTQRPARELHAARERLTPTPLPELVSLRPFEPSTLDQGASSSCTGGGSAHLTAIAATAGGHPLGWTPSPRVLYAATRALARGRIPLPDTVPAPALEDRGAMPSDVAEAISRYGVCPMRSPLTPDGRVYDLWTADDTSAEPANVNDEPEFGDLLVSGRKLVVGEYRIDESAPDVVTQIRTTLAQLVPVGNGGFVDTQVLEYSASSPPVGKPNEGDPRGGGHWSAIVGYKPAGDGSYLFEYLTSWGASYGDAGHWWATEAFVRAQWDLYAWNVRTP